MYKLITTIFISACVAITMSACMPQKKLQPGEAEWLAIVEKMEEIIATGDTGKANCMELRSLYADAEVAFKELLKHIEGFGVRTRDQRMGIIKEYKEQNC